MKILLLGSAMSLAMVAGASAADLPTHKAPAPSVYDWSGLYVGGHIGGGWARNELATGCDVFQVFFGCGQPIQENAALVQSVNSRGFLGGIQGGTNYQIGKLVVGAEADFSWGRINGRSTALLTSPLNGLALAKASIEPTAPIPTGSELSRRASASRMTDGCCTARLEALGPIPAMPTPMLGLLA